MKTKLKIWVDQDEVLAHWVAAVIRGHNERYGTKHKREDVSDYFRMETLLEGGKPFIREYFRIPGLYSSLEPMAGAAEGMRKLIQDGHDVGIISSVPSGISWDEKQVWLTKFMPFFDLRNFKSGKRKDDVLGDILVDDSPDHIKAFAKTKRLAVAFASPWNKGIKGEYIQRAEGWTEVLEIIENYSRY